MDVRTLNNFQFFLFIFLHYFNKFKMNMKHFKATNKAIFIFEKNSKMEKLRAP